MGFKLVRVDATEPYKVLLPIGSHFIGRGKFLDCNDNRVSRTHAELIVTKDSVLLKSLHQNPCFLKKKSSTDTIIFSQPDSQVLTNGDQFGLIPDSYWYEVIQYTQESTENVQSEDVPSKNENLNNLNENGEKESDTQFYKHEEEDDTFNCSEYLLDGAVNAPLKLSPENQEPENELENRPPDHLDPTSTHQPVESTNQNEDLTDASIDSIGQANEPTRVATPKRVHSEENSLCFIKRVKTEPLDNDCKDEAKIQPSDAISNPEVKIEPSSPQDGKPGPSNDQGVNDCKDEDKTQPTDATTNPAVKTEPSSPQDAKPGPSNDQGGPSNNDNGNPSTTPQSPTKPPNKPLRERCMYGANCYRSNDENDSWREKEQPSKGKGKGKGRGKSSEPESLLKVRVVRKLTQKRIATLSPAQKKELNQRKRNVELQRVLLPDAPPRKRKMLKPSLEREVCEFAPTPSTSAAPQPPQALPSVLTLEALEDIPFIVVPADREFTNATHDAEEGPRRTRRREIGLTDENFEWTVLDWPNSDCDDDDLDKNPILVERLTDMIDEENLTPTERDILDKEDNQNDRALQEMLPDDCFTFEWTKDKATFKSKRETFTGTPGPTFDMTDIKSPIDIFEKMLDVEFIDRLAVETNRYAKQTLEKLKDKLGPKSRFHRWTPTDRTEIIAYMAVMILHGLYPQANEESYFSFNGYGTMPFFMKIMSYNRYLLLKTMFNFADNTDNNDDDKSNKLYKVQPVTDYFNEKFSSLYYPQQEIAIDESLLKWHGRLSFAQKISTKAAKVGVKTYELCESSTGYLWQFKVYTGKSKTTKDNNDNSNEDRNEELVDPTNQPSTSTSTDYVPTNATAKIVFDLVEPLLHRGHTLIMDNFYNCPLLARCLKLRQTDCYGTQRLNREFIPTSLRTISKTDLRQGEVVASYCRDLSLMVWRDANIVSMISTYHSFQIGSHNKTTNKPSIVLDYNKYMGGVDRKDQYLAAQPVERTKSRVWYKKLFRRIFNAAIFNCYVIYASKHARLSHRQFRITLVDELLKTYRNIDLTTERRLIYRDNTMTPTTTTTMTTTTTTASTATTSATTSAAKTPCLLRKFTMDNRPMVESNHFPTHGPTRRGRCWWCSQKKLDSRTAWQCIECRVNLCIVGCFMAFHKP